MMIQLPRSNGLGTLRMGTMLLLIGATGVVRAADLRVYSVDFSSDGSKILTAGSDRKIQLWDAETGRQLKSFMHHGWVQSASLSPDGKYCLSGARDQNMRLWDLGTGEQLRSFAHSGWVVCTLFSADGKTCFSLGTDHVKQGPAAIRAWDPQTGRMLHEFGPEPIEKKGGNSINWGSLSKDGKLLATSGSDVRVWNPTTGELIRRFEGHEGGVWVVAISPDGETCVSGGMDKTVRIWSVKEGRLVKTIEQAGVVRAVAISPDGKHFATGGTEVGLPRNFRPRPGQEVQGVYYIRAWNLQTGREVGRIDAHQWIVESLDFSPNGTTIVSGSFDDTVKLWDTKTGKLIRSFAE